MCISFWIPTTFWLIQLVTYCIVKEDSDFKVWAAQNAPGQVWSSHPSVLPPTPLPPQVTRPGVFDLSFLNFFFHKWADTYLSSYISPLLHEGYVIVNTVLCLFHVKVSWKSLCVHSQRSCFSFFCSFLVWIPLCIQVHVYIWAFKMFSVSRHFKLLVSVCPSFVGVVSVGKIPRSRVAGSRLRAEGAQGVPLACLPRAALHACLTHGKCSLWVAFICSSQAVSEFKHFVCR